MKFYWCWRCKDEVPMLEEHEWELLQKIKEEEDRIKKPESDRLKRDFLAKSDDILKRQDDDKGKDLEKLKCELTLSLDNLEKKMGSPKEDQFYKEILGGYDTEISEKCSIFNHARPLYGMECENCGRPLRGPSSTYCFECGWKKKV